MAGSDPEKPSGEIAVVSVTLLEPVIESEPPLEELPILGPEHEVHELDELPSLDPAQAPGLDELPSLDPAQAPGLDELPSLDPVRAPGLDELPSLDPVRAPGLDELAADEVTAGEGGEETEEPLAPELPAGDYRKLYAAAFAPLDRNL